MPREFYSRIMVAHKCCNYNCFVKRYLGTKQWPINDEPVPVDQVAGSFRTFDPSASSRIKLTTCAVEWFNAVKPPTFNFVSNLANWTSVSSIFSRLRHSLDHNIILVSSFQYQSFDWIIVKWARLELSWFRVQRSCFYKFKGDDKHVSINIENYAIEDSDIDLIWWTVWYWKKKSAIFVWFSQSVYVTWEMSRCRTSRNNHFNIDVWLEADVRWGNRE